MIGTRRKEPPKSSPSTLKCEPNEVWGKNVTLCNWEGPFCQDDNNGGDIWNGGNNDFQKLPWPCYGNARLLQGLGKLNPHNPELKGVSKGMGNCATWGVPVCNPRECRLINKAAMKYAQEMIDENWDKL